MFTKDNHIVLNNHKRLTQRTTIIIIDSEKLLLSYFLWHIDHVTDERHLGVLVVTMFPCGSIMESIPNGSIDKGLTRRRRHCIL